MSAMELFRSRIEQSAKAAADTARQLSSLDDMAQKDDYVQSKGLRVSAQSEHTTAASSFADNSVIDQLSGSFVDAFSTAARTQNRPRPSTAVSDKTQSTSVKAVSDKRSVTERKHQPKPALQKPLMSSVAALYDQNNKQKSAAAKEQGGISARSKTNQSLKSLATANLPSSPGKKTHELHASILHQLDYDSDTDSSEDDNTRKSQNNNNLGSDVEMLEQELEESISRQNLLKGPVDVKEQKDVHRFMRITADLESEREVLLKSLVELESIPESTPRNPDRVKIADGLWSTHRGAGDETSSKLLAGMSWVRNVATPQLEALSKQIMTKVSETDASKKSKSGLSRKSESSQRPMIGSRNPDRSSTRNDTDEEKIMMTTSASFLADDDMAELNRIKMRNSSSKVMLLITTCIDNPRFAFIAVTLVFALFAYFYSRHRSVDDVL